VEERPRVDALLVIARRVAPAMVSRRRKHGSASSLAWAVPLFAVLAILGLAEELVSHVIIFVPAAAVAVAGGYLLGRRHGALWPSRQARARRLEDARRLGELE
jgi:hypothetical protein